MPATSNYRRYDDVLKLVASVLFGTSVREFANVVTALQMHDVTRCLAYLTAILFFCVYFRNIHGVICLDLWATNSAFRDPFDRQTRHIARDFAFAFVGVLFLPFFFIFLLNQKMLDGHPVYFTIFLFAPLAIYWLWNDELLWQYHKIRVISFQQSVLPLAPDSVGNESFAGSFIDLFRQLVDCIKTNLFAWMKEGRELDVEAVGRLPLRSMSFSEYSAYNEFLGYLMVWRALDRVSYIGIMFFMALLYLAATTNEGSLTSFIGLRSYEEWFCFLFIVTAFVVTLGDYVFNASYYFPMPNKFGGAQEKNP